MSEDSWCSASENVAFEAAPGGVVRPWTLESPWKAPGVLLSTWLRGGAAREVGAQCRTMRVQRPALPLSGPVALSKFHNRSGASESPGLRRGSFHSPDFVGV